MNRLLELSQYVSQLKSQWRANGVSTAYTHYFYSTEHEGDAHFPPRPAGLSPIVGGAAKSRAFGTFRFSRAAPTGEAIRILDNWQSQNITSVNVLAGKALSRPILVYHGRQWRPWNGNILFNTRCIRQLQNLWNAWYETRLPDGARMLDRISTFDGGFVPRFIRGRAEGTPAEVHSSDERMPLSNHAWGSAFDINANLNPYHHSPPTVGQPGCVRELVIVANQHGFFWGGHFGGDAIDGMHFEVARTF